MQTAGTHPPKAIFRRRFRHARRRWGALFFLAICSLHQFANSQAYEDTPTIRVEAREVLIPTSVAAFMAKRRCNIGWNTGYNEVLHLGVRDFHLYVDGKEQPIANAALARPYWTDLIRDNVGYQRGIALSPTGEWTSLRASPATTPLLNVPLYLISYKLPEEVQERSCHRIKITIDPKDGSGSRLAEIEPIEEVVGNLIIRCPKEKVKRSKLQLQYRTQYCDAAHASANPLDSTSVGKELESVMIDTKAEQDGFYVSAFDLFEESGRSRIRVALDFPQLSLQTGNPGFQAALLGVFTNSHGELATRFSDSAPEGCIFPWKKFDFAGEDQALCGRETFFNHYEAEVILPPSEYLLQLAIDFGGTLRRGEVHVAAGTPPRHLAVSGIALCRRYFAPIEPQLSSGGVPALPFDLKPLVSKGIHFTPTGNTLFKKDDPLAAYFEIYEPPWADAQLQPDVTNVRVQFEMRILDAKSGAIKSDTGYRPADEFMEPGKSVIPISEMVKINELVPGEYQLQVRATDSAGNTTDWRSASFTRE